MSGRTSKLVEGVKRINERNKFPKVENAKELEKKKKRREKGKEGRKMGHIGRTEKSTSVSVTTVT